MKRTRTPFIVVVSAPSGSGKTTVVSRLLEGVEGMVRSVSYTTREPRSGEEGGKDYIFVTQSEFLERKNSGDFLECEENFGERYGTSRQQVEQALAGGKDVVLTIDVKGARAVKKLYPESVSVFIMPPSEKELVGRLLGRKSDDDEQVRIRIREAKNEIAAADDYDYMIINDDLDRAVVELKTIIAQERTNREKIKKEVK